MGLFMELGPCTIKDSPKSANDTKPNPHSWNNHANIFFLDEPVGVGYSRAKHGQVVDTAEKAGKDVAAFVSIFFDAFKEFQGRAFHMSGESYGVRPDDEIVLTERDVTYPCLPVPYTTTMLRLSKPEGSLSICRVCSSAMVS